MAGYKNFREFYPFYLKEHRHPICRLLHCLGSMLILIIIAVSILRGNWRDLIAIPFVGYGFAWMGHFVFEKNQPATFKHPFYSLLADWVMFKDVLTGREKFWATKNH